MGRPKKYESEAALERAVNAYLRSISYRKPVIVETATGVVDENGHAEVKRVMLREGEDGTGKPVTVTEWLKAPSVAGLCLSLGISKETWSNYGEDEKLRSVTERFRLVLEDYYVEQTEGKGSHGAQFVLKNNFGLNGRWTDKQEVTQTNVELSMEEYLERLDGQGKEQAF